MSGFSAVTKINVEVQIGTTYSVLDLTQKIYKIWRKKIFSASTAGEMVGMRKVPIHQGKKEKMIDLDKYCKLYHLFIRYDEQLCRLQKEESAQAFLWLFWTSKIIPQSCWHQPERTAYGFKYEELAFTDSRSNKPSGYW